MTRIIRIESCKACPSYGHKGAFAPVSYVPVCRSANKELPHTVSRAHGHTVASVAGGIPEWCPLERAPAPSVQHLPADDTEGGAL